MGSPSLPYLQLQREGDCWIALCIQGGCSGRSGQECSGKSCDLQSGRMMEMPAPGCSLALPEPCSPWGSAAQGLYQPTAAGLDRGGSFPALPLDHVPLQPWLSAPAIPSTLALSFSGCFLVQTPPFTLASLKIPFPPLFLQPGEQGRGSVLSNPKHSQSKSLALVQPSRIAKLGIWMQPQVMESQNGLWRRP